MSNTIDNRVVQMGFESKNFEKGAKKAIKQLDELEEALDFSDSAKSFKDVEEAAAKLDFKPLKQAVDETKKKIDVLSMAANWAVKNVVDPLMNSAKSILKSFTIDPIISGYDRYTEKVSSVQTLLNSTGLSIESVNNYLNRLSTFSDETSYSFTQMTSALATMTSAGGDIETLIPMLEGVANATAFAGKGASAFSGAIYNLNQSYAGGYLTYLDYNSLDRTHNMFSKQLKQAFIDCAKAAGTLDAEGKTASGTLVEITNFAETLSEKWADRTVMENAFGYFAEMTEEAQDLVNSGVYDTFSEAYDAIAENYDEVQAAAAKSAQEAKTFTEAIDATKDAVSSGFMESIELLIGGYDEAKVLWTDLANTLYDLFAQPGNERNEILTEALTSKWEQLNDQLTDAGVNSDAFRSKLLDAGKTLGLVTDEEIENLSSLEDVLKSDWMSGDIIAGTLREYASVGAASVKSAEERLSEANDIVKGILRGEWGKGEERIQRLTEAGYDYAEMQGYVNTYLSKRALTEADLTEATAESVEVTEEQREALEALADEATDSESAFGSLIAQINDVSGREKLLQGVKNVLGNFATILERVHSSFAEVFSGSMAESVASFIDGFFNLSENLKIDDTAANSFQDALSGIMSSAQFILQIGGSITSVISPILGIVWAITSAVIDLVGILGRVFSLIFGSNIAQTITSWVDSIFSDVNGFLYRIMDAINGFRESIAEFVGKEQIQQFFTKLGKSAGELGKKLSNVSTTVKTALAPIFDKVRETMGSFIGRITTSLPSWDGLKEKIQNAVQPLRNLLDVGKKLIGAIDFSEIASGISTAFDEIKRKLGEFFSRLDIFKSIRNVFEKMGLTEIIGKFAGNVSELQGRFSGILSMKITDWFSVLRTKISEIRNVLSSVGETVKNKILPSVQSFISERFSSVLTAIAKALSSVKEWLGSITKEKVQGWFQKLADQFNQVRESISSFWEMAKDAFGPAIERIKQSLGSAVEYIKTNVWPILKYVVGGALLFGFGGIAGVLAGIGGIIAYIITKLQGTSKEKLQEWLSNSSEKLEAFHSKLRNIWTGISNFFAPAIKKIKKVLSPVTNFIKNKVWPAIQSFVEEIANSENPLSMLWQKIKSLAQPIQNLLESWTNVSAGLNFTEWGEDTESSFESVRKKLDELFQYVKQHFSDLDLASVVSVLAIAAIIAIIYNINKAITTFTTLETTANSFVDAAKSTMQSISKVATYLKPAENTAKDIANNVVKIVGALVALLLAVYLLSQITDTTTLWNAVIAVAALATIIGIFSIALTKIGASLPPETILNIDKIQTSMIAFAGSILLLAVAVDVLSQVEINSWGDIAKMLTMLISIMVVFGGVLIAMSHLGGKKFRASSLSMVAMAASVLILTVAMNLLSDTVVKQGPEAMEALGKLILMIAALGFASGSANLRGAIAIYTMIGSILFLVRTLKQLETFDFSAVSKNMSNIMPLVNILLVIFALLSLAAKYMKDGAKNVLAIAASCALIIGCVYLMAIVFEAISEMDQAKLTAASSNFAGIIIAIMALMGSLGAAAWLAGENTKSIIKVAIGLLAAVGAVYLLFAIYKSIAAFVSENQDVTVLKTAGLILAGLVGLIAILMLAAGGAAKLGGGMGLAYMIVVAVMLLAVLVAFYALAPLSEKLGIVSKAILFALLGIAAVIAAMGIATKLASKEGAGKGAGLMVLMIIPFLAVAAALYVLAGELKEVPWQNLLITLAGMALVLIAMAGAVRLASGAELSGIGAMLAMTAALVLVAAAIFVLCSIPFDQLWKGAATLMAAMLVLVGIGALAGVAATLITAGILPLIVLAATLMIVAYAIQMVASLPYDQIKAGAIALGALMGAMLVLALVAGATFAYSALGTVVLAALAVVLILTASAFAIFAASMYNAAAGILYLKGAWEFLKTGSRDTWDMAASMDADARAMRSAAENTQDEIDTATDGITESIENQNEAVATATEEGTETAVAATEAQTEAVVGATEEQAEEVGEAQATTMTKIKDLAAQYLNKDLGDLTDFDVMSLLGDTDFNSILSENGIDITSMLTSGSFDTSALGFDWSSVSSSMAGTNVNLFQGTTEAASSEGNTAGDKFSSAYNTSVTAAAGDTYTSGLNFVQGLIDGIADMTSPLIGVVEELARAALEKINEIWDENSPSKETAFRGMHFVNGLIVGIKDNEKYAVYAVENLAGDTLDALNAAMDSEDISDSILSPVLDMNDVLNQMNSFGESSEWNPTIHPTLDMSGVNPGLRNLNAIASYRSGAGIKAGASDSTESGAGSGGVTFNQYNTSPKALSRLEIYRQTKNQISFIERVTRE